MRSALRFIWLFMATILAGAVVVGGIIAFGMVALVIGTLVAGIVVVMFIHRAWLLYRSNRRAMNK